jgi:hypothetical protein
VLNLLAQFLYLQVLDLLTTLVFLAVGISEANPVIRLLAGSAGSPLGGLLVGKAIALGLACCCWRQRRRALLGRVNFFYAGLVLWNLAAILSRTAVAG